MSTDHGHASTQGWTIRLVGLRLSDNIMSQTQFDFEYVPEDYYGEQPKLADTTPPPAPDPCIFCALPADGTQFPASLPSLVGPARFVMEERLCLTISNAGQV